jgi:hypothetical protein
MRLKRKLCGGLKIKPRINIITKAEICVAKEEMFK